MNHTIDNLASFYNITDVRKKLKQKTIQRFEDGAPMATLPSAFPAPLYIALWYQERTIKIMQESFLDIEENSLRDWTQFYHSLLEDSNAVGLDAAMYAWTVINEEDRWENLDLTGLRIGLAMKKERATFEKLKYGLITKCYTPIYRAAQYLAEYTQLEEDMDLPEAAYNMLHKYCSDLVYKHCTLGNRTLITNQLNNIKMVVTSEEYYGC